MRYESRTGLAALRLAQAATCERILAIKAEFDVLRAEWLAARALKFSPDQPRDARGRWTDGANRTSDNATVPHVAANDGTPGNNRAQNKQVDDVVRILGLTKDQRQTLHLEISGQNMGFQEILRIGREIKGK